MAGLYERDKTMDQKLLIEKSMINRGKIWRKK